MEMIQKMMMEKVMGSVMGGGGSTDSSKLQAETAGLNPDQLKGYLHTATMLMGKTSGSNEGWTSQANSVLQALDSHLGGGGPTTVEDLKSQAENNTNPDFQKGQELAMQHHGASLGAGSGEGVTAGGGYGQTEKKQGWFGGSNDQQSSGGYSEQGSGYGGNRTQGGEDTGGYGGGNYGSNTGGGRQAGYEGQGGGYSGQEGGYGRQDGGYGNQGNQGGGYGNQDGYGGGN